MSLHLLDSIEFFALGFEIKFTVIIFLRMRTNDAQTLGYVEARISLSSSFYASTDMVRAFCVVYFAHFDRIL